MKVKDLLKFDPELEIVVGDTASHYLISVSEIKADLVIESGERCFEYAAPDWIDTKKVLVLEVDY